MLKKGQIQLFVTTKSNKDFDSEGKGHHLELYEAFFANL